MLPTIVLASVSVDENVASAMLHLLQCALHCSLHDSRKAKAKDKSHDKAGTYALDEYPRVCVRI